MNELNSDTILEILVQETQMILPEHKEKVAPDAPLSSMGFDSITFMELLVSVERRFHIKLIELGMTREDMQTLKTLAHVIHRAGAQA